MLLQQSLSCHIFRSFPRSLTEPLKSNDSSRSCLKSDLFCSRGSCIGDSSFRVSASLPQVSTEDRATVSGSILSQNDTLLDRLLLDEGDWKTSSERHLDCENAKVSANDLRLGGLDNVRHSYSEKFVIRCYEVGMNRTASIEAIANLLQEVACNHAQSVGFSTDGFATTPGMRKRRLIWVTTRMHIEVEDYPTWGDVVEIETWCQAEGKAGTRRDWLISDVSRGKLIGRATSTWVMMNQDSRRLSRITDDVREEYANHCPVLPRYAFPEENSASLKKISKLEDPALDVRSGLMPRRGDLDMNQHVNNVTYIGWTLESIPPNILDTHQLHRITLDYRRECKHGDAVESLASVENCFGENGGFKTAINGSAQNPNNMVADCIEFLHLLRMAGCEVEINRGRTLWKKKSDRAQR